MFYPRDLFRSIKLRGLREGGSSRFYCETCCRDGSCSVNQTFEGVTSHLCPQCSPNLVHFWANYAKSLQHANKPEFRQSIYS